VQETGKVTTNGRRPKGPEREDYAHASLRIGVHAIRRASGSIDVERLKAAEG
jgi:hypothetical protein